MPVKRQNVCRDPVIASKTEAVRVGEISCTLQYIPPNYKGIPFNRNCIVHILFFLPVSPWQPFI